jgi:hypothetical protein
MIRFGRCDFVEDSKMSKHRDWTAYWCVNHSVRTTSAMSECLRAALPKDNWSRQKPSAPAFIDELEQEIARLKG